MQIVIPVTPFSNRCIRFEEGRNAVIDISTRHPFYTILSARPNKGKSKRAIKYCTESVSFNVPKALAKMVNTTNVFLIGYLFHQHYQKQMLHTIYHTNGVTGQSILPQIKTYLELRNISEDDFALETAYKAWQRYQIKILEKQHKIGGTELPVVVQNCSTLKLDSEYVENKLYHILNINKRHLVGYPLSSQLKYDQRAVCLFILHRLTSHTYRSLSEVYGIQAKRIFENAKKVEFVYVGDHEDIRTEMVKTFKNKLLTERSPIIRQIVSSSL